MICSRCCVHPNILELRAIGVSWIGALPIPTRGHCGIHNLKLFGELPLRSSQYLQNFAVCWSQIFIAEHAVLVWTTGMQYVRFQFATAQFNRHFSNIRFTGMSVPYQAYGRSRCWMVKRPISTSPWPDHKKNLMQFLPSIGRRCHYLKILTFPSSR